MDSGEIDPNIIVNPFFGLHYRNPGIFRQHIGIPGHPRGSLVKPLQVLVLINISARNFLPGGMADIGYFPLNKSNRFNLNHIKTLLPSLLARKQGIFCFCIIIPEWYLLLQA